MSANNAVVIANNALVADSWDIGALRRDTPGCCVASPRLHLNNAGASFSPLPVVEVISDHLALEQQLGGYEAAASRCAEVDSVYRDLAALINCSEQEISHAENATRAWSLAFSALFSTRRGRIVLAASTEYGSNELAMLRSDARVEYLEDDAVGAVDVEKLIARLAVDSDEVLCVSLAWIGTNGGLVQPAAAVGEACEVAGVPFLLDACQAIGQIVVDVKRVKCDALAGTGRKFLRGPRGVGFLYVRKGGWLGDAEPVMLDVCSAKLRKGGEGYDVALGRARWEGWERSVALWIGLGRAARYAVEIKMERVESRVIWLGGFLRRALGGIDGVTVMDLGVNGKNLVSSQCGIVSFKINFIDCTVVKERLAEMGANVSVSSWSSTRQNMTQRDINDVVRASVHYFNSEEELTRFVGFVDAVVKH